MSRLSLAEDATFAEFLSTLRNKFDRTRPDLSTMVNYEQLDAISSLSVADQAEFHSILLESVPLKWLPPRHLSKARALFAYICGAVKRSTRPLEAPTAPIPSPTTQQGSDTVPQTPRGQPMTMAEAKARSSMQNSAPNVAFGPVGSTSKRTAATSDAAPVARRRVDPGDQGLNPPSPSTTVPKPIASASNSSSSSTALHKIGTNRPTPGHGRTLLDCYSCGSREHSTVTCDSAHLAVTGGRKPSIIHTTASKTSLRMIDREVTVCPIWLYKTCKQALCPNAHLCPLCENTFHHPSRCHLLVGNPRRPRIAPAVRPPRPQFVPAAGPVWVMDTTLGRGFKDSWQWNPTWRPYPDNKDHYGTIRQVPVGHRAIKHNVKHDGPLGSFKVDATTLCSEAAAFLAVTGHVSRIVPGAETRTGQASWADDSDEILKILEERIYPMHSLPDGAEVELELERVKVEHEDLVRRVMEAEATCVGNGRLPMVNLEALKAAVPRRFQEPDGVPRLARLIVIGNYPVPHDDIRGLTPMAFSTRLIASLGITSPTTSHDFAITFRNRVAAFHPPSDKAGIYYPGQGQVKAKEMPAAVVRVWEEDLLRLYGELFQTAGSRVIVTYGEENTRLVAKATSDVSGSRVFRWTCRSPAINFEETASSTTRNAGLRAMMEGVQKDKLESYDDVEEHVWLQMSSLNHVLKKELSSSKNTRWSETAGIPMVLVHGETSTTLFLTLEHPQTVDAGFSSLAKSAALNLGTTYASDFARGSLFSGRFNSPEWPFVDAFSSKCDRRLADKGKWCRGKRYEEDHGVLKTLSENQTMINKGQPQQPFYFGLHHLPPRFADYLEGIEFVRDGQAGATKLDVSYSDVVGLMMWSVKRRGNTPWKGVAEAADELKG